MNASGNYFIDVLFAMIGLHATTYLIYGKITRKSLIGGYKPGMPGYNVFLNLVSKPKYLIGTIAVTLLFIINAIFDARAVLRSSSPHSVLIVVPIMVILVFILGLAIVPPLLGKSKK